MFWIYHEPVELYLLSEICSLYQSCCLDLLSQVIYLLLDVMYSFPNKEGASVESFPTAFAIPIGLVKLVQGFWLLDHNDHQVHASFGYKAVAPGTIWSPVICFKEMVVFVSTRVHSSCSYTRLSLSVSLSGSMNECCRRWCAKASTRWPFATFTLWSPPFPPPLRPNSRCLSCYKTGKNDWRLFL